MCMGQLVEMYKNFGRSRRRVAATRTSCRSLGKSQLGEDPCSWRTLGLDMVFYIPAHMVFDMPVHMVFDMPVHMVFDMAVHMVVVEAYMTALEI